MKNYLSFGGGVNSVALHLLLLDQGVEFESVFVHHGTDWPETYDYIAGFQWWLKSQGHKPITVLRPDVGTIDGKRFSVLFDYYRYKRFFPSRQSRACTDRFKITSIKKYQKKPCWVFIGYASDEAHRAKITSEKGVEYRWPLIEHDIDRAGCIEIIKAHYLPVPRKSGCYICPFQKVSEFKELREKHPILFCAAKNLENKYINRRAAEGKPPIYISRAPLSEVVNERQRKVFEEDEYPPCQCGL